MRDKNGLPYYGSGIIFKKEIASTVCVRLKPRNVMRKSVVGDPIFWPGLVYSPINLSGLLFALGTVSGEVGLLFEEFSKEDSTAVCRRKTNSGWEKITATLTIRSSDYADIGNDIDLIICWIDDKAEADNDLPVLELSTIIGKAEPKVSNAEKINENDFNIFPEDPTEDLLQRGESIADFEDTVRQLDERIKKLKNG